MHHQNGCFNQLLIAHSNLDILSLLTSKTHGETRVFNSRQEVARNFVFFNLITFLRILL